MGELGWACKEERKKEMEWAWVLEKRERNKEREEERKKERKKD